MNKLKFGFGTFVQRELDSKECKSRSIWYWFMVMIRKQWWKNISAFVHIVAMPPVGERQEREPGRQARMLWKYIFVPLSIIGCLALPLLLANIPRTAYRGDRLLGRSVASTTQDIRWARHLSPRVPTTSCPVSIFHVDFKTDDTSQDRRLVTEDCRPICFYCGIPDHVYRFCHRCNHDL